MITVSDRVGAAHLAEARMYYRDLNQVILWNLEWLAGLHLDGVQGQTGRDRSGQDHGAQLHFQVQLGTRTTSTIK